MSHADRATLVAYWLGELDESQEAAIEEHYLGCAECSAQLAEVEALADGVRRAFAGGLIRAVVTPRFVEQLRSRGLRLREYRVPCNGSVNCSVAPEDDVLLSRLQVPLDGVERVDLIVGDRRFEDVAFDAASGEVVVAPSIAYIRTMPAYRNVMRLVAVEAGGERVLGEYTFHHSPHS
jgi:hypothetical protein